MFVLPAPVAAAAGPPACKPARPRPARPRTRRYGWETTHTAGLAGWVTAPIGPAYNRSHPLVEQTPEQLVALVAQMAADHARYNLSTFWVLAPGPCSTFVVEISRAAYAASRFLPLELPSDCLEQVRRSRLFQIPRRLDGQRGRASSFSLAWG